MTEEVTPEEADRLAKRAAEIWGENPFSPERMAADAAIKAAERDAIRAKERYNRMTDLHEVEQDRKRGTGRG